MMTLYEYSTTRSIRCRWILNELNLSYTSVTVDLTQRQHKNPEFLSINPSGKIPVLVDDGLILSESAAICNYLAEKYSDHALIPQAQTSERAAYDKWTFFCMTELEQPLWTIARHSFLYPEGKRVPQIIPCAVEEFKDAARILNDHLAQNKMVLGDPFSAVDILVGQTLAWSVGHDSTKPFQFLANFPHIRRYLSALKDRPAMPKELQDKI